MRTKRRFCRPAKAWRMVCCLLVTASLWIGCSAKPAYSGVDLGNAQQMSESIAAAMRHRSYQVTLHFTARTRLSDEALEALADELTKRAYEIDDGADSGDYLRYQSSGVSFSSEVTDRLLGGYDYKLRLRPQMYTTAEEEEVVTEEVKRLLAAWGVAGSEEEAVRRTHGYLTETVAYDTVHKAQGSSHVPSTAYGALIFHTALCQGYAVAAYRLMKEQGVAVRIVTGETLVDGTWERHAWNIVTMDGQDYHVDATLDAVRSSADYVLVDDETMAADHRNWRIGTDE